MRSAPLPKIGALAAVVAVFALTAGLVSAAAAADPLTWTLCASEGQTCTVTGTQQVRYGANGTFTAPQWVTNNVNCTNAAFGTDPVPGVVKHCEVLPQTWTPCASEGQICTVTGTQQVRYGANGRFTAARTVTTASPARTPRSAPIPSPGS